MLIPILLVARWEEDDEVDASEERRNWRNLEQLRHGGMRMRIKPRRAKRKKEELLTASRGLAVSGSLYSSIASCCDMQ